MIMASVMLRCVAISIFVDIKCYHNMMHHDTAPSMILLKAISYHLTDEGYP